MTSRDRIIARLKSVRVKNDQLPVAVITADDEDRLYRLTNVLEGIGGTVIIAANAAEVAAYLKQKFPLPGRWISMIPALPLPAWNDEGHDPHTLENVQLAIIGGQFAVAENGAVWVTSDAMGDRALPFICEHLALIVKPHDIVATMADAYARIGTSSYDFGTFIAGPSKTADIEQSLVLGAHGPKSLTLFLMD